MDSKPRRRVVVVPAITVLLAVAAAGCGSSPSHPRSSPTPTSSTSAGVAACKKLQTTLASAPSTLGQAALDPKAARPQVVAFVNSLKTEAAPASPTVRAAVNGFGTAVLTALTQLQQGKISVSVLTTRLTQSAGAITTACKNNP